MVDEVTLKFKDWVIYRQYRSKKHKHFSIRINKLCDMTG